MQKMEWGLGMWHNIIINSWVNFTTLLMQIPGVITECIDVADLEAVKRTVESLTPIHLLVNNAGVAQLQHILDVTPEVYDK